MARSRGLRLLTAQPVIGIVKAGDRVIGVRTTGEEWIVDLDTGFYVHRQGLSADGRH